jgi:hypothetical protein
MMLSGSATWVVFEITTPNNESYKRLQSKRPEQISQRPGRATVQKMPKPQHSPNDKSKLPSPRPFRVIHDRVDPAAGQATSAMHR